jgi:predicted RecB family nuclease
MIDEAAPLGSRWINDEVTALVTSSSWIDLHTEMRRRVESLNGLGLKIVAKALGFHWHADDAGGDASMLWYQRATSLASDDERRTWQQKILEYNEDDVRATRHLREWFQHHSKASVPVLSAL